jgi:hypothetical protein
VLESAIANEKKTLLLGLSRTEKRLAEFEREFGISSAEFEKRLNNGELEETEAFTDWRMEMGMLNLLKNQYQTLQQTEDVKI